ncbi:MAG: hypothetical protein ACRELA_07920 [Candidatus Rokuibacteriota bacterium]
MMEGRGTAWERSVRPHAVRIRFGYARLSSSRPSGLIPYYLTHFVNGPRELTALVSAN